jgi:carbamoyltransferase
MYILGVNISHDPSACLLEDGKIIYYSEDERLTGLKKPDGEYDDIIEEFYTNGNVKSIFTHIDTIKKYTSSVDYVIFSSFGRHDINNDNLIIRGIAQKLQEANIQFKTLLFFEDKHHIYHAANAFYASGFEDAAALVMDGGGAYDVKYREEHTSQYCKFPFREVESIYTCTYDFPSFNRKYQHFSMLDEIDTDEPMFWKRSKQEIYSRTSSCGDLYSIMAQALDMDESTGTAAGKVMGLSGHRMTSNNMRDNINILNNYEKQYSILNSSWFHEKDGEWVSDLNIGPRLEQFINDHDVDTSLKGPTFDFYICASLAHKLQVETFKQTCRLIQKTIDLTGKKQIVLSGGYFMNCVNNYKYTKEFPEVEFFVDPMPHDAGTAIGAAKYLWYGLTKSKEKYPFKDVYFGPSV